ncbi:MAG TPA: Holliday junction branch migration protein RuvA [Acidimicrobiia bacterium]
MIGSVRGTVVERDVSGEVLVEVGGVGYRLLVPLGAIATLEPGERAFLFTHLHVRDDAMTLYGFPTRDERDTFEVLLAAAGVGPTLALKILSVHAPGTLACAVADEDLDALTQVPGVGKRTAERLMVELRARLELPESRTMPAVGEDAAPRVEVREALTTLGYAPDEIRGVLSALPDDGTVQELLRSALRQLAVRP